LITAGQISPTVWMVLAGLVVGFLFVLWERHREATKKFPLIHLDLFKNKVVKSGVGTIAATYFLLGGLMYSLALFLQMQLQFNAIETGLTMLPLSFMILVLASRGSTMAGKYAPRKIIQTGF